MIDNKLFHVFCGAAFSATMLLSLAPASFAASPSEARMAQEHHACAVIMGLDQADVQYEACVRSLDSNFPSQIGQAPSSPVR